MKKLKISGISEEKGCNEKLPPLKDMKFRLNTVTNSKNSMAKIFRKFIQDGSEILDIPTFKACVYFFSQYIACQRLEKEIDIEKRIKELEERIEQSINS